ncbi:MAG: glycogen/starch/alpha-glucan phosphorylase, partial [Erysipelothrix sp.]|nr:glycogen/starch/alpha-glucan phosphorylase [Erysipelothrix sp.]
PELMRIMMDDYGYEWDTAWKIVIDTMGFTNHTVLSEALERWSIQQMKTLLPRIYMIIREIDNRFQEYVYTTTHDRDFVNRVQIIRDNQVHMAHLAIVGSHSVNGVASLHTRILIEDLFKDFYRLWPEKFNNKTNGVTHRRWLTYSNPQLHSLLSDTIGDDYVHEPSQLIKLLDFVDNEEIQNRFLAIKQERKQILIDYIKSELDIEVPLDSIIDTQAKRLHAYKRQLLNALHIMYLIQTIRSNPEFTMHHQTFVFSAKAAPSYVLAKKIIKLINNLSVIVEEDARLSKFIKVVFIPNYNVSIAEILLNASDVSEQISTAGKEASGTGNMKFMMNGAMTLGTYDGANVEIDSFVGPEDDIIFGLRVEDVRALIQGGYNVWEELEKNPDLKAVVDSLIDGSWADGDVDEFRVIYDELLFKNDEYLLIADFEAYRLAQLEVQRRYQDSKGWARSMLINIAKSGYFSSDRTINEYAEEIWDIKSLK